MLLTNRFGQPSLAPRRAHAAAGRATAAPGRLVCAALKLGPYEFPTKDEARAHIRNILGYTNHDCMILPDSEDGEVLTSLVQRHPRAAEKIGCGISYFTTTRRWHDNVPTKHFVLYRTDGTSTDFSYLKCLKMTYTPPPYAQPAEQAAPYNPDSSSSSSSEAPAAANTAAYTRRGSAPGPYSSSSPGRSSSPSSGSPGSSLQSDDDEALPHRPSTLAWQHPAATYRTALRNAVRGQTLIFEASAFLPFLDPMFCPLTGVRLTLDNCRAVETPATPFLQLVDEWLKLQGCALQHVQVEFNPPRSGSDREWPVMSDPQQKFSWQEFYKERAQLQLVSHAGYGEMQNRKKAERRAGNSGSMGSSWQADGRGHQQAADSSSSSSPSSSPLQSADETLPLRLSPPTKRLPAATYRTALRDAVRSAAAAFKAVAFESHSREPMFCPGNGWQLTPDNCRAVETPDTPFSQLIEQWLQQQGCELEGVQVGFAPPLPGSNKERPVMADPRQKLSWQEFYMAHVQLQLVSHAGFSWWRRNNHPEQRAGSSSSSSSMGSGWQGNRQGHQQAADSSSSSDSGLGSWQQATASAAAAAPAAPAIRLRRTTGTSSAGSSGGSSGTAAAADAGAERGNSSSHLGSSSSGDTAPAAVARKVRVPRRRSALGSSSGAREPPVQSTAATAAGAAAAADDDGSAPSAGAGSDGVAGPAGEAAAAALSTAGGASANSRDESSSNSSVADAPAAGRRRRRRL